MEKNKAILNSRNLDELIEIEFGKKGTKSREEFDKETEAFCLAETLKEERIRAGLTLGPEVFLFGIVFDLFYICNDLIFYLLCVKLKNILQMKN